MDVDRIKNIPTDIQQFSGPGAGRERQTERDPIPGTPFVQVTDRDESGRLLGIAIDRYRYVELKAGALVFDRNFVAMRTTMNSSGMLRNVKTPYAHWQELYKLDDRRLPVAIDGMRIQRDSQNRVIACRGYGQNWRYQYHSQNLVQIEGPFGLRRILRDADGRPIEVSEGHRSQRITYDRVDRRQGLPEIPLNFHYDDDGRLRAVLLDDGYPRHIYLWDGYNCLARLDGEPGSPLAFAYSLDLTGTPVRIIGRERQIPVPRDAFGENLMGHSGHPGIFGGTVFGGFTRLRSRILDCRTGSFNAPDPLQGGPDDPRRDRGYGGPLVIETPNAGPYAVCQYDPITYLDPTGEIAWYYVISTLTWAFPNNILSWIGLEATANFWGTFFTAEWSDWADAEHWTSDRLDIGGVQRQSFFAPNPGGAFTTQHIIWARHAYIDSKRFVTVFDPQGTYQPNLYGSMLRVVPGNGDPFLLQGQMTIGSVTQPAAMLWSRAGGEAVECAPGQRVPIFPAGGFHFPFNQNVLGPQSATMTEIGPTAGVGIGTLDNNSSIQLPAGGPALAQGDLVLLTDGGTAVEIIAVVTTIPEGGGQIVRLAAAPGFTATTGITFRKLDPLAWNENLQNNSMPAVNYLDASATGNAYQVNDALQLNDGTTTFDARITGFETRLSLDAPLTGSPAAPLTVFATATAGGPFDAEITAPTELEFTSGSVPSEGDFVIVTDGSTTLAMVVGAGSGRNRAVDRDMSGLSGPAVNWQPLNRGSDLGTQTDSIAAGQLTYPPASLNSVPAAGDHVGILDGGSVTQLRTVTSLNHHALVLNTSAPLPASTAFSVDRFPVGAQINNLTSSQTVMLALASGNVTGAVALQVYQFGGTAVAGNALMVSDLSLTGAVAEGSMATSAGGTLTPGQPVAIRATGGSAGNDEGLVVGRVERDILINYDFTSSNTSLEIVQMALSGFAYDATISGTTQVVVSPIVSTSGTPTQVDMPLFFTGECVELVDASSTIIGQYRIDNVPEGTVIELANGPALPAVGTAVTVQKIAVTSAGNGAGRIGINGRTDLANTGGSSRVIRADVWNRDGFFFNGYIGVVDANQTVPFRTGAGAYDATVPAANQVDMAAATIGGVAVDPPLFGPNEIVSVRWLDTSPANQTQNFQINGIAGTVLTLVPVAGGALNLATTDTNVRVSRIPRIWVEFTTTPNTSGPVDLYDINAANTQFFAEFTRETNQTLILDNPGTLASPSPNAVMVVPLQPTGTPQAGELGSGNGKVPEDPENWENDRHQMLVEHELRHTEQYLWWGPMFITLIPLWPVELTLELTTDIEQPDFGPFQQGTLAVPEGSGAMTITFEGGGDGGFSVGDQVQVNQGAHNHTRNLADPADGESGFRIQRIDELRAGTIHVRRVNGFPDWYRVLHASWFRTLSIGGLTQLAASLTHGLFFQIVGRFFYMIGRAIEMACCDDRQEGTVQGDKRQVRLSDPSKRNQLINENRLLVQEPRNFGNAVFSGIDTVVRSRQGPITDDGVITLSAPLSWDDGTTVNIGPYQSTTPGQLLDWKTYYPATVQTDNFNRIQIHPVGDDTLELEPFDRLRVLAEGEFFGMFGSNRTVMSVTGDMVELDEPVPVSGTAETELTVRISKIGTEDPFDFLDTVGVDELTGGGWLRWATDPFGQLYWETRPEAGSFWDILARVGKYVLGTKAWTNPILITSRYFMEAMTQELHNVSLEQDASEQSGDLYTPIGRIRGEAGVDGRTANMTVGDIARFWYFGYEFSNQQNSSPPVDPIGTRTTDPGFRMDEPGNKLLRDLIVYPQVTAEVAGSGGVVNLGAQAAAPGSSPGLDMADAFWQKDPADPNEVSATATDRRMIPNDLGLVPQGPQTQLSSACYLAFTRSTNGNPHRATMDDNIDNGADGRDAQDNDEQRLFYTVNVRDVTVSINSTLVNDGAGITLLRTQRAAVAVNDEGMKRYAVLVLQPDSGSIVRAQVDPENVIIARDPFSGGAGPFSEPFQICRWHEWDSTNNEYKSGGLAEHGMHLPVDVFIPIRKLNVNVVEFPPVLSALPATMDFSIYPAAGSPLPSLQPGAELFFPVAANIITATQALSYATPPAPDNTVIPDRSFVDASSRATQEVRDFLGDGLVYALALGEDDVPEEQSTIQVVFTVGGTSNAATITMNVAVEGHFLARDTGTLAGSGYEISAGDSGVLDCVELDGTTNVTPDDGTVQFTLRDGSPVPQITTGGSPVEELTFSAAGNQLSINLDAGANASLDSGFRRLLISNTGGTMKASRTIKII
ncbi:MAG: hypothetical protein GY850_15775 [bacterium]|nr:hypothetical protein [bacterium]